MDLYPDLLSTKDGKPYYRCKTKSGSLLFCSDVQLQIAASCESLFVDGTFSTCPAPYYQVLYLNGRCDENVFPLATALLPNKLQATYQEIFEAFNDLCDADFVFIHGDCEKSMNNAVQNIWPSAQLRLCRFHVLDAIRRHANSLGLRSIINRRPDFKKYYARIRQVFFLVKSSQVFAYWL